jgi:GNAT-family acetyltransferase (TIGR03103 family)
MQPPAGPTSGFLGAAPDAAAAVSDDAVDDDAEAGAHGEEPARNVTVDCGWGRVVFGQTFEDHDLLAATLADEQAGRRDVCLYAPEAHVLVSQYPDQLFIDPSHTFRLLLDDDDRVNAEPSLPLDIDPLRGDDDAESINHIYARCGMVAAPTTTLLENQRSEAFIYLLARDRGTGATVGTVTGIDHTAAFGDRHGGTSLWCLAVDPQSPVPGVGEALVLALARHFRDLGRHHLDLSVMHDNAPAIALYEKLGFQRVPVLCVKRKNPINEPLFARVLSDVERLNPYARIIADEARRRGIAVEVLDAEAGELRLSSGGREIITRESLSELTSAVAMSRCDDKRQTRRLLEAAGLRVPRGQSATGGASDLEFLEAVGSVVVKPVRGEQGRGVTVAVNQPAALERAVAHAATFCPDVLLEEYVAGHDLRLVVIGGDVVAAAVRAPATVVGNGEHTVVELIERQSRRRAAATGGESTIPLDDDTLAAVAAGGHTMDDVLATGVELPVRRTANLHTGGTIHDVTDRTNPALRDAAVRAADAIGIPVTGIDLIVPDVEGPDYVFIEANERPGLANHEPQPTAERFVDLLFPGTEAVPRGWEPEPGTAGELHVPDSIDGSATAHPDGARSAGAGR